MGFMLMRGRGWPVERAAPPPPRPTSRQAGRLPRSRDQGTGTVGRWAVGGWGDGKAWLGWRRCGPGGGPSGCRPVFVFILSPHFGFYLPVPSHLLSISAGLTPYLHSRITVPFVNYTSMCGALLRSRQCARHAGGVGWGTRRAEYGDAECVPRGSGRGSKPSSGWESGRKRHLS